MKYLCYLFLVTAVHGYGLGRVRRETNVPAPHIRHIIAKDNGFIVQWDPVKSDGEPVLGYKLKVKEIKEDVDQLNTSEDSKKNGDKYFDHGLDIMLINEVFKGEIVDIDIKGADNTEAVYNGAKLDTWYEFRVVAYSKSKESVESDSNRLKINSPKPEVEKKEDIIAVDPSLDEESMIDLHV